MGKEFADHTLRCQHPGCEKPIFGHHKQRYCSPAHAAAAESNQRHTWAHLAKIGQPFGLKAADVRTLHNAQNGQCVLHQTPFPRDWARGPYARPQMRLVRTPDAELVLVCPKCARLMARYPEAEGWPPAFAWMTARNRVAEENLRAQIANAGVTRPITVSETSAANP